jgi:hypothetical protein
MRTALVAVALVWLLGCVWSFREQSEFAAAKGFAFPHLLPLVIDGFAVAMAGVAWAASLDARPAVSARFATLVAVAGSAASNGTWAWIRTTGPGAVRHDQVAVALGVAVPVAANLAFEVLLAELRRQVQRRRGLPAPVAVPYPRLIRVALAPISTVREWRALALELTQLPALLALPESAAASAELTLPGLLEPEATGAESNQRMLDASMTADRTATAPRSRMNTAGAPAGSQPASLRPAAGPGVVPASVTPRPRVPAPLPTIRPRPEHRYPAASAAVGAAAVSYSSDSDQRVEHLANLLRERKPLTGALAGEELGCSARTGRRLLREAEQLLEGQTVEATLVG